MVEENIQYLDVDEDHLDGDARFGNVIEKKNGHKIKYLQNENTYLKQMLEDAENNVIINKNMIKVII